MCKPLFQLTEKDCLSSFFILTPRPPLTFNSVKSPLLALPTTRKQQRRGREEPLPGHAPTDLLSERKRRHFSPLFSSEFKIEVRIEDRNDDASGLFKKDELGQKLGEV